MVLPTFVAPDGGNARLSPIRSRNKGKLGASHYLSRPSFDREFRRTIGRGFAECPSKSLRQLAAEWAMSPSKIRKDRRMDGDNGVVGVGLALGLQVIQGEYAEVRHPLEAAVVGQERFASRIERDRELQGIG